VNRALRFTGLSVRLIHAIAATVALGGCYKLPLWTGVVDIEPIGRVGVDRCGDGAPTALGERLLWRHPYLQSVRGRSAIVAAGIRGSKRIEVRVTRPGDEAVAEVPLLGDRLAAAHVTGLEQGLLYCYQLAGDGGALTAPGPLRTAAPPGRAVRLVVLGDTGTGSDAQRAIAARLGEVHFDLALFLGDLAYPDGTAAQLDARFFGVYRDLLRLVPAFTAIGNHDRATRGGAPYLASMFLPGRERYYSFDWGDVHFVAIDTTRVGREQLEWLDLDLNTTDRSWVIVFGHHPLYSSSFRGPRTILRRRFLPILRRHRVDLVLAGHEHHYERFRPIGGVTGVVSGGGGGRLTRSYGGAATAARADVHHFLHIEVSPVALLLRAISIDGVEIDRLELAATRRRAAR
jgi:hypothetical protein